MESLAENEAETAGGPDAVVADTGAKAKRQQSESTGTVVVEEQPQPGTGCAAPFFGVKHYLNHFYGIPDDASTAKIWRQIQAVSDLFVFFCF